MEPLRFARGTATPIFPLLHQAPPPSSSSIYLHFTYFFFFLQILPFFLHRGEREPCPEGGLSLLVEYSKGRENILLVSCKASYTHRERESTNKRYEP